MHNDSTPRVDSAGNTIGSALLGTTGVILVILKLAGVIDWSWWLVLMPFYFGIGVLLVAAAGVLVLAGIAALAAAIASAWRRVKWVAACREVSR